jgi:[amino group carrier protein]-lysine/ornithine hydrolase
LVSDNYAIELLKKSLDLYTPSKSEGQLANLLKDKCINELGFEQAHIDSVGNIIATKGRGNPRILLCGHMDTVPNKVPVRIENGFLYGRGASDAKAPLISMLLAASEFPPKQNGTIIFAGLVDEEGNATGSKHLVKNNLDIDYAIFGEPSGIGNITISYKGRLAIKLICDVLESAHASAPWLAKNSIEEAYSFWNAIKTTINNNYENEKRTSSVSCCLTEISGGSSHNVTPQKCRITMDLRIPTSQTCQQVLNSINDIILNISKEKGVKTNFIIEDSTEPFEADFTSPLVRSLVLSVLDVCKKRPMLLRKTGTGDMNIIGNAYKIPVVTYGPGDPHSSHSINENIRIDEYLFGIEIFKRSLFHMSRIHNTQKK